MTISVTLAATLIATGPSDTPTRPTDHAVEAAGEQEAPIGAVAEDQEAEPRATGGRALNVALAFGIGHGAPWITDDPRSTHGGGSSSTWADGLGARLSASVTYGTVAQFGVRATGMMAVGDDAPSAVEGLVALRVGGVYFVEAGLGLGYASTASDDTMGGAYFGQVGWFFTREVGLVLSVDYTSNFFSATLGVDWMALGPQSES